MMTPREQAAYAWVEEVFASPEDWSLGDVLDAFEAGAQWATENPRRVETAEELDALPVGAIVRDDDGDYWIKHTDDPKSLGDWRHWQGAVTTAPTVFSLSASAFLTLLWLPEVSS